MRRAHDVNFGDKVTVRGDEQKCVAWVSVGEEEAGAFTVYASARLHAPEDDRPWLVPTMHVEWGNGGASVEAEFPVVQRLRVPVAASMIRATARLVDTRARPVSREASCVFSTFIARGASEAAALHTDWLAVRAPTAILAKGPQRLAALRGINVGNELRYVMLFDLDRLPTPYDPIAVVVPARPVPDSFELRFPHARGFKAGLAWGISRQPLELVTEPDATVRLELEMVL
jgi:hypothetical protein